MKYVIVDSSHLFNRHISIQKYSKWDGSHEDKAYLAINTILFGLLKLHKKYPKSHIIFALEGGSNWRKDFTQSYKLNRALKMSKRTEEEIEQDQIIWGIVDKFVTFVKDHTNISTLKCSGCEADDMIAFWIQSHPNDEHIIYSGDTDFIQLLARNVTIYDSIKDITISDVGVKNDKNKVMSFTFKNDGKIKVVEEDPLFLVEDNWVEWCLFLKTIRGDSGDYVWPAIKGMHTVKLKESWNNREANGFLWNNLMQKETTNRDGSKCKVKDIYERNKILIHLTEQPEDIKVRALEAILECHSKPSVTNIAFYFNKLCKEFTLERVAKSSDAMIEMFGTRP